MMKVFLIISIVLAFSIIGTAQTTVSVIDFVKIKNEKRQEAIYYYENNWKVYRDIALKKGYIVSYKLLTTAADAKADFDLILITEYADDSQYKLGEERFQQIIKETNPNGAKLLNDIKPNDFRENIFFKEAQTLFTSSNKKQRKK